VNVSFKKKFFFNNQSKTCKPSNLNIFKNYLPSKKFNSNLRKSENFISKIFIGDKEINMKEHIQRIYPLSPHIGNNKRKYFVN